MQAVILPTASITGEDIEAVLYMQWGPGWKERARGPEAGKMHLKHRSVGTEYVGWKVPSGAE